MISSIQKTPLLKKEIDSTSTESEEDQKRAEIGKVADQALLVANDLESLAGPPALRNIQKQEEAGKLRKTFQSTAKKETTAQYNTQFLKHSQNIQERLTKPLLTPFVDSMDHQDLTTGDAIHGIMFATKIASLGALGRVAAQNPVATAVTAGALFVGKCTADVVAVGVDATLEVISPSTQKAVREVFKSVSECVDRNATTFENRYGVSREQTHGFITDVAGFAAGGVAKGFSKVGGDKILPPANSLKTDSKPLFESPKVLKEEKIPLSWLGSETTKAELKRGSYLVVGHKNGKYLSAHIDGLYADGESWMITANLADNLIKKAVLENADHIFITTAFQNRKLESFLSRVYGMEIVEKNINGGHNLYKFSLPFSKKKPTLG